MIRMIVAVDTENAIGWKSGELPWHLSQDLKLFKEKTKESVVVMGRATFESLNIPSGLPNRINIVISSKAGPVRSSRGTLVMQPPLDQFDNLKDMILSAEREYGDLWIIGGASVYTQVIQEQLVDELHVTRVHCNSGADVQLPFDFYQWVQFPQDQSALGITWEMIDQTNFNSEPAFSVSVYRKVR